jgi:uncharacterized protein
MKDVILEKKQKVCILSIDGGGIRGIIPAIILQHIEEKINSKTGQNENVSQYFDLVAGTSTGGILACGMLMPKDGMIPKYSVRDIIELYEKEGPGIFKKRFMTRFGHYLGCRYDTVNIRNPLNDYFGETKLSELIKPCIISAYDIDRRRAHFFTSFDAVEKTKNFFVRDVLQATSAAPTYFEPAKIKSLNQAEYALIDGGVFVNNPALCAYAEARKMEFPEKGHDKPDAKDMIIISMGTGSSARRYLYDNARKWGAIGWISPLIDIMMSASSETVHYQLKKIYESLPEPDNSCYYRLQLDLSDNRVNSEMDDASKENIDSLKNLAYHFVADNEAILNTITDLLLKNNLHEVIS